jgi:hypothetical protein
LTGFDPEREERREKSEERGSNSREHGARSMEDWGKHCICNAIAANWNVRFFVALFCCLLFFSVFVAIAAAQMAGVRSQRSEVRGQGEN